MGIPQILVIVLYAMSLGISLVNHGKRSEKTENAGVTLIATIIIISLLWWGGFWR